MVSCSFFLALSVFFGIGGKGPYEFHSGMIFDTRRGIAVMEYSGDVIKTDFRQLLKESRERNENGN